MVTIMTTPERRPVMAEAISALQDLTVLSSPSFGAEEDVEMDDAYWAEQSDAEMSVDMEDDVSVSSNDNASLRGGARLSQPPALAWARRAIARPRKDDEKYKNEGTEDEEDYEMEPVAERDYQSRKNIAADDDDGNSTSSDWDGYGNLRLTMDEYDKILSRLEGSEDWNAEQRKLHKLIYMRGLHPMLPSWWRISFRMWGVTQPHLDDVFRPKNSKKRVAIHAYGNELAASKALESLFYLSQYVTDYEEIGYQDKITCTVVKNIRNYIRWAMRDAGIDMGKTQLNMFVRAYPPDFLGGDEGYGSDDSDFAPSPISVNSEQVAGEITVAGDDSTKPKHRKPKPHNNNNNVNNNNNNSNNNNNNNDDNDLTEAERTMRFTEAVSKDVERRLRDMGQRWRELLRDKKAGGGYRAPPPTLYAFAVVQHIVLLASHDSGSVTNPVVVLEQVRLNDRGQWLWNALSLALPVNIARDSLYALRDTGTITMWKGEAGRDPDM
ncbi:hypothetical protein VTI74DRAFT_3 [Chaetomium olivicolor]